MGICESKNKNSRFVLSCLDTGSAIHLLDPYFVFFPFVFSILLALAKNGKAECTAAILFLTQRLLFRICNAK